MAHARRLGGRGWRRWLLVAEDASMGAVLVVRRDREEPAVHQVAGRQVPALRRHGPPRHKEEAMSKPKDDRPLLCKKCLGTGRYGKDVCSRCGGSGRQ